MKLHHKQIFISIGIFWLIILGGFVGMKEWTLQTGTEVLLDMRPVDPRDLFRGDYVILSYQISALEAKFFESGKLPPEGTTVYVLLDVSEENVASVSSVRLFPPDEGLFLRGTVTHRSDWRSRISVEYGIESYFVPEGMGRPIERQLRNMQTRIAIDKNGTALIKNLVLNGQDYILQKEEE